MEHNNIKSIEPQNSCKIILQILEFNGIFITTVVQLHFCDIISPLLWDISWDTIMTLNLELSLDDFLLNVENLLEAMQRFDSCNVSSFVERVDLDNIEMKLLLISHSPV